MAYPHAMVDLETLGTDEDSAIISIGACKFDYEKGIGEKFYENIIWDLKSRTFSIDTLQWWITQGEEASKVLLKDQKPIGVVMDDFREFFASCDTIWSNGSSFDCAILDNYYNGHSPWMFWQIRDVRTVNELGNALLYYTLNDKEFKGVKHNALDDAINQAEYVCEVMSKLNSICNKVPTSELEIGQ